jgi:hypothetical protein
MIGASGPSLFAEWYRQEYDLRPLALNQTRNQSNLQDRQSEAHGAQPDSSIVKEVPSQPGAKIEKREEEKAKQDRRLADYTEFLFFATLFLGVATAGLVVVAYCQMREARKSIDASVTAADAAKKAAQATRTSAEAQKQMASEMVRPRIRVRQVNLEDPPDPLMQAQPVRGNFTLANIGGVDARVVVWRCQICFGINIRPIWHLDAPMSDAERDVPIILAPGVHAELPFVSDRALSPSLAHDLFYAAKGANLYVMGRITYEDELGVNRITGFCRQWGMAPGEDRPRLYRFADPDWDYED